MTLEIIKYWICNIGGALFTILLLLYIMLWVFERLFIGWHNKNVRKNIAYWITHKKEINAYIEKNRKIKKTKEVV